MIEYSPFRDDFPFYENNDHPIYLDNAATTQKPKAVIDRLNRFYINENSNAERSVYELSRNASLVTVSARDKVKKFIKAGDAFEVIFTSGATGSINLLAAAFCDKFLASGDNIVTTQMEHHSNFLPWKKQCDLEKAELKIAPINKKGQINPNEVLGLIDSKTKIVAISHMSNVTGYIPDLKKIISGAHKKGAYVFVDSTQAVAHQIISMEDLDCDFLCFSAHKVYGPMGVGVLCGKTEILKEMRPYQYGGGMVYSVSENYNEYKTIPDRFEAGTLNIAGIAGLDAALSYLMEKDRDSIYEYERALSSYTYKKLMELDEISINLSNIGSPIISFNINGISSYDLAVMLSFENIAVRSGKHCTHIFYETMNLNGACRVSLSFYNTKKEADKLVNSIKKIIVKTSR